jgi:hypothetical protein
LNVESHGYSSNGLCKINDKLICSGAENYFFIICIGPLQVIQKFPFNNITVYYIYVTKEDYLYCSGKNCIAQYKIIKDEDNNFIELVEIDKYYRKRFYFQGRAILPFDDGRIFISGYREYILLA